jgi:hypothetical protein
MKGQAGMLLVNGSQERVWPTAGIAQIAGQDGSCPDRCLLRYPAAARGGGGICPRQAYRVDRLNPRPFVLSNAARNTGSVAA